MSFWTLLLIALGVSADAFAVALGRGLHIRRLTARDTLAIGLSFGLFQGLMPVLGWLVGTRLQAYTEIDHWVAFGLLVAIGGKMLHDAFSDDDDEDGDDELLLDWRAPASRPFYTATGAHPEGVHRRRQFLSEGRELTAFTDEMLGRRDFVEFALAWWPPLTAEQVFGWSEDEATGRPVDITFTPEDREKGVPAHERQTALDDGLAADVRWHLRKDGMRVFINGTTRPLPGPDASPIRGVR